MLVGIAEADHWKSAHAQTHIHTNPCCMPCGTAPSDAACSRTVHYVVGQSRHQLSPLPFLFAVRLLLLLSLPGRVEDDMTSDILLQGRGRGYPQRMLTKSSTPTCCPVLAAPPTRRENGWDMLSLTSPSRVVNIRQMLRRACHKLSFTFGWPCGYRQTHRQTDIHEEIGTQAGSEAEATGVSVLSCCSSPLAPGAFHLRISAKNNDETPNDNHCMNRGSVHILHTSTLRTSTLRTSTHHISTLHTSTLRTSKLRTSTHHTSTHHISTLRTSTLHTSILRTSTHHTSTPHQHTTPAHHTSTLRTSTRYTSTLHTSTHHTSTHHTSTHHTSTPTPAHPHQNTPH